jgi:hypothetical protein
MGVNRLLPEALPRVGTNLANKGAASLLLLMALPRMGVNRLLPEALPRVGTNLANKAAASPLLPMALPRMVADPVARLRVATSLVNKVAENQLPLMARLKVATSLVNKAVLAVNRPLRMAAGLVIKAAASPLPAVK